ncbi:Conserved_hypothetical protein [Hexamita inflata]|uniref:Cleavage and polyadenylation specificity factor 100 kDa subunit n=1 Tax=Hexamita inflata TaxID=28002 RepID=A0AA86NVC3_9EUKA|nr:Conserved hypothetical protein [Hexamita inflata]
MNSNQIQISQLFPDTPYACTIIKIQELTVMLDCGGQPPYNNLIAAYTQIIPQISAIIVTSSAPNSCGALPLLMRLGYQKQIYIPAPLQTMIHVTLQNVFAGLKRDFQGFTPVSDDVNYLTQLHVSSCLSVESMRALEPNKYLGVGQNLSAKIIMSGREASGVYLKHSYFQEEVFYAGPLLSRDLCSQKDFLSQNEVYGSKIVKAAQFNSYRGLNLQNFDLQQFQLELERYQQVLIFSSSLYEFLQIYVQIQSLLQSQNYKAILIADKETQTQVQIPVMQKIDKKDKIVFTVDGIDGAFTRYVLKEFSENANCLVYLIQQKPVYANSPEFKLIQQVIKQKQIVLNMVNPVIQQIEEKKEQVELRKDEVLLKDFIQDYKNGQLRELDLDAIIEQLKAFDIKQRGYERPVKRTNKKILILDFATKCSLLRYLSKAYTTYMQFKNEFEYANNIVQLQLSNNPDVTVIQNPLKLNNPLQVYLNYKELKVQKDKYGEFGYKLALKNSLENPNQISAVGYEILAELVQLIQKKYKVISFNDENDDEKFEFEEFNKTSLDQLLGSQNIVTDQQKTDLKNKNKEIVEFKSIFDPQKKATPLKRRNIIIKQDEEQVEQLKEEKEAYCDYQTTKIEFFCHVRAVNLANYCTTAEFMSQFSNQFELDKESTTHSLLLTKPFKFNVSFNLQNTLQQIKINLTDEFNGQSVYGKFMENEFVSQPTHLHLIHKQIQSYNESEDSVRQKLQQMQFQGNKGIFLKGDVQVEVEGDATKIKIKSRAVQDAIEVIEWI